MNVRNNVRLSTDSDAFDDNAEQIQLEQVMITLETICARILDMRIADARDYNERLQIQLHFKNIVTPVSLALAECKGPRHFHQHFKHSDDPEERLEPAANPPALDVLSETCTQALKHCQKKLANLHDEDFIENYNELEHALRNFVLHHRNFKLKQETA